MQGYDAPPWTLQIGRDHITNHGFKTEFTGSIRSVERLPIEQPRYVPSSGNGLWRLQCSLPLQQPRSTHPLLASGITGKGNLLFVKIEPDGKLRLGLDQWGVGATFSEPLVPGSGALQLIECYLGPQAARHFAPESTRPGAAPPNGPDHQSLARWPARLERTPVRHHLDSYDHIEVGTNTAGFSSTPERFAGELESRPYTDQEAREFLHRNLNLLSRDSSGPTNR
jgi:hypothetical protein